MPRLVNAVTGVTVSVEDDTAANLDPHMWTAADKDEPRATSKRKPE
jgi:hypothetical protein